MNSEMLIVGFNRNEDGKTILLVGKLNAESHEIDILNALDGNSAAELYEKLIGSQKKQTPL